MAKAKAAEKKEAGTRKIGDMAKAKATPTAEAAPTMQKRSVSKKK